MLGIKESKEMVSFIAAIINGVGKSMEDGIVTWMDARYFIEAFQKASEAFKDSTEILGEIKDYTDEERVQLINVFSEECNLDFESAEEAIEYVFSMAINLTKVVNFIDIFKNKKDGD